MECGDFVKIGVSDNVDRRAKQIPYKVKRVYASEFLENGQEVKIAFAGAGIRSLLTKDAVLKKL